MGNRTKAAIVYLNPLGDYITFIPQNAKIPNINFQKKMYFKTTSKFLIKIRDYKYISIYY